MIITPGWDKSRETKLTLIYFKSSAINVIDCYDMRLCSVRTFVRTGVHVLYFGTSIVQSSRHSPWMYKLDVLQTICRMSGDKGLNPTSIGTIRCVVITELPAQTIIILRSQHLALFLTGSLIPSNNWGRRFCAG